MAIPVLLLKALPYIGAVALVGGAVAYIDHKGYKRAEQAAELEKARDTINTQALAIIMRRRVNALEGELRDIVTLNDNQLMSRLDRIQLTERTVVQPTLIKEIASAPRFTDPNAGISDGMLRAINTARSVSWPDGSCVTNADGSATCKLPAPGPTPR